MEKLQDHVATKERLAYGSFFIGQNILYMFVAQHYQTFLTVKLELSPSLLGLLLMISLVWELLISTVFGVVLDKMHFKSGKFMFWIRLATVVAPILFILLYVVPRGLPTILMMGLLLVSYLLFQMIYTIGDIPIASLATAMTDNLNERNGLIALSRITSSVGVFFVGTLMVFLLTNTGYNYFLTALFGGIVAILTMLPISFFGRERISVVETKKGTSLKDFISYFKGNRYLLIFYSGGLIYNMFKIQGVMTNILFWSLYRDMSMTIVIMVGGAIPSLLVYAWIPKLLEKVNKITIFRVSLVIFGIVSIIQYFIGYSNVIVVIMLTVVRNLVDAVPAYLMFTFASDCVEYGNYKTGQRKEGITFSIQSLTNKVSNSLCGVFAAIVYGIVHYRPELYGVDGTELVPVAVQNNLWLAFCLLPLLGAVIALLVITKYNLQDKDVQIMAEVNTGRLSREEGERLLSQKY
jgi:GPH family glycoside/pentoside/hexuronide:cation symporter